MFLGSKGGAGCTPTLHHRQVTTTLSLPPPSLPPRPTEMGL